MNIKRVERLTLEGRMHPAGTAAFARRSEERTGRASYERREEATLVAAHEKRFRAERAAWRWFESQAPWYRRTAIHWVVSAKKEETRLRRLETLIESSKRERTVPPLTRPESKR